VVDDWPGAVTARTERTASWQVWPGLCATFIGVGLGRFAYTPLIPFLIESGDLTGSEAAFLGAANLAGYLVGALAAARLGRRLGEGRVIRWSLATSVACLLLCVVPAGFWWLLPWRFLIGIAGSILMILAPSVLLAGMAAAMRGRAGGVIYTGVGLGIMLSSVIVAPLAAHGVAYAWAAMAASGIVAAGSCWRSWRIAIIPSGPEAELRSRVGPATLLLIAAYAMDGAGFVPHTVFWVDFITRELALGAAAGSLNWVVFGVGAVFGPILAGSLADRIGIGHALVAAFGLKAAAVLLPVFDTGAVPLILSSFLVGALSPGLSSLVAARLAELAGPAGQARLWGQATLAFALAQAGSAYGMSFALGTTGRYLPLYAAAGLVEAIGMMLAFTALFAVPMASPVPRRSRGESGSFNKRSKNP
jgi:MFS family permease